MASSAGTVGASVLPMLRRAGLHCLQFALVILGVSTLLFFLLRLSGDPVLMLLPPDAAPGEYERLRHALRLDAPLYLQYGHFLAGLVALDFGTSLVYRQPALTIALDRLPATFELTAAAVGFSIVLGFVLGGSAAIGRRPFGRVTAALTAAIGQSMPAYWLGVLLILVFSVRVHWLPPSGQGGLRSLILPMVTLGLQLTAKTIRMVESGIRGELREDYVRTARGKGLRQLDVVGRHVIPNTLIPVITVLGVDIGHLMGGAVVTETIFAWPGVGRQLVAAVLSRDYAVVEAIVFLVALFVIAINLAADVAYQIIDPRVRR